MRSMSDKLSSAFAPDAEPVVPTPKPAAPASDSVSLKLVGVDGPATVSVANSGLVEFKAGQPVTVSADVAELLLQSPNVELDKKGSN